LACLSRSSCTLRLASRGLRPTPTEEIGGGGCELLKDVGTASAGLKDVGGGDVRDEEVGTLGDARRNEAISDKVSLGCKSSNPALTAIREP
jgi:hypothetical protein